MPMSLGTDGVLLMLPTSCLVPCPDGSEHRLPVLGPQDLPGGKEELLHVALSHSCFLTGGTHPTQYLQSVAWGCKQMTVAVWSALCLGFVQGCTGPMCTGWQREGTWGLYPGSQQQRAQLPCSLQHPRPSSVSAVSQRWLPGGRSLHGSRTVRPGVCGGSSQWGGLCDGQAWGDDSVGEQALPISEIQLCRGHP